MAKTKPSETGLFVTNHLNLMFSLASGLIMPPSGFGDKYYQDTLGVQPGSVPLFINKVPKDAIDLSIGEATHLIPVIVEINLSTLNLFTPNSQLELFEPAPSKKNTDKSVKFACAPISITQILQIDVDSDETRERVLSQVQLRNNVPLNPKILRSRKKYFTYDVLKRWCWKPESLMEEVSSPIHLAQALGGILAMLNHVESKSMSAKKAFSFMFGNESTEPPIPGLGEWIANNQIIPYSKSVLGYLLWGIVEKLAEHRDSCNDNDLDDIVLHFLENVPEEIQTKTKFLCKSLMELGGLGGATIPEYFNLHTCPFERAVILFFLRRQCEELLEFEDAVMTDLDWAYSAILFGTRSGWLRLSMELRRDDYMEHKICNWMASYCH